MDTPLVRRAWYFTVDLHSVAEDRSFWSGAIYRFQRESRSAVSLIGAGDHKPSVIFVATRPFALLNSRLEVMREFHKNGWRVVAVAANDRDAAKLESLGFEFHGIDFRRKTLSLFADVRALVRLVRIFRFHRPALIHIFQAKPMILGNLAARSVRTSLVVNTVTGVGHAMTVGGLVHRLASIAYRLSLRRSDMTVFQNPHDRETFVASRLVDERNTRVILGAGVDLQRFSANRERPESQEPKVLMVTRLIWSKGVGEYVEAARICSLTRPGVVFQLAGELDPIHPHAVEASWIEDLAREGVVDFLGYLDKVEEALHETDVFVFPSYYPEGVPRVLLEAAACGLPVVTTDVPGCRDAVLPDVTGILVPPRDQEALAGAIGRLLDDAELRGRMGGKGRAFVEYQFDIVAVAQEHLALYRAMGVVVERPGSEGRSDGDTSLTEEDR